MSARLMVTVQAVRHVLRIDVKTHVFMENLVRHWND